MGDTYVERLERFLRAYADDDADAIAETVAEDAVWHVGGAHRMSGDYQGREAVLGLLRGFHELTQNRLKVEPRDVLEGDEHLMSFTHVTAEREGDKLDVIMADAMRFGADGRVGEFCTLSNDQRAVDAFIG